MAQLIDGIFSILEPEQYLPGHIIIGVFDFLEAITPLIIYFSWAKPRIEKLEYNPWYKHSWRTMAYGSFMSFSIAFFFWMTSFEKSVVASKIYVASSLVFGGLYAFYVIASTIIYQFQAVRNYRASDHSLEESEIWWAFGIYLASQVFAAFIGQHYIIDSYMYVAAEHIKDWCEERSEFCTYFSVLDVNEGY